MKLNKNGWLIRFAYGYDVPTVVTVCGLFWKTAFVGMMYAVFIGFPLMGLYSIGLAGTVWFFAILAGCCGFLWLAAFAIPTVIRKQQHRQPSLLWAYIKAKKDRYCPIIELE
jgi:hypothetical protein